MHKSRASGIKQTQLKTPLGHYPTHADPNIQNSKLQRATNKIAQKPIKRNGEQQQDTQEQHKDQP